MDTLPVNTLDPNALGDLKRLARDNDPEAIKAAAKQFESLFLAMVLKTMRSTVQSSGLMDSDSTKLYQSLLDQQLAANMAASKGTGLADALVRQLGGDPTQAPTQEEIDRGFDMASVIRRPSAIAPGMPWSGVAGDRAEAIRANTTIAPTPAEISSDAAAFVREVRPYAEAASRETGIPAHFMIAQAALETGWGKYQLRNADGEPSRNLFNIKAGSGWQGETVAVAATEYVDGRPVTENSRFRAYGSYADSFRDYARLMSSNPRYAQVLNQQDAEGFARELQSAGYATDPAYADKLTRIINGSTLRSVFPG